MEKRPRTFFINKENNRLVEIKSVPYSHLPQDQIKPEWDSSQGKYNEKF